MFLKPIIVTNRALCCEPFLERIKKIVDCRPYGIILREKDLEKDAYLTLAQTVKPLCDAEGVRLILNWREPTVYLDGCALELSYKDRHAPIADSGAPFGLSIHSVSETADVGHASWLIAGHIFPTACKAGLPGRGIPFLSEVCARTELPVFAIGGITAERLPALRAAGADGYCIMSAAMRHPHPKLLFDLFYHYGGYPT